MNEVVVAAGESALDDPIVGSTVTVSDGLKTSAVAVTVMVVVCEPCTTSMTATTTSDDGSAVVVTVAVEN